MRTIVWWSLQEEAAMDDAKETTTTQEAIEAMVRQHDTGTTNKTQAEMLDTAEANDEFKPEMSEADRRDSTPQHPI